MEDLDQYQRVEIACHFHVLLVHLWRWAIERDTREAWRSAITSERIYLKKFR